MLDQGMAGNESVEHTFPLVVMVFDETRYHELDNLVLKRNTAMR